MSQEWKNIVVENSNGELDNIEVASAKGFTGVTPVSQGGFGATSVGGSTNAIGTHGIWGNSNPQGTGTGRFTPVLAIPQNGQESIMKNALPPLSHFSQAASVDDLVPYDDYHNFGYPGGHSTVYIFAKSPVGQYDEDQYPYYFHEWASKDGVLGVPSLMPDIIEVESTTVDNIAIINLNEQNVPADVTFDNGQTGTNAIKVNVGGTLAFPATQTASLLSSAGAWTDGSTQTTSNDQTFTFLSGGDLDNLEYHTGEQFGSGFRIYNIGTKVINQFLIRGGLVPSPTFGSTNSTLAFNLNHAIDDLTSGGWTLSFNYSDNQERTVTTYSYNASNTGISQSSTNRVTLTYGSGDATGWEYLINHASYSTGHPSISRITNLKFASNNQKQSLQFGLSCDDSLGIDQENNISRNSNDIYPSVFTMCGNISADTSTGNQNGSPYASQKNVMMTVSPSQSNGLIGGIAITDGKPQIRVL